MLFEVDVLALKVFYIDVLLLSQVVSELLIGLGYLGSASGVLGFLLVDILDDVVEPVLVALVSNT